MIEKNHGADQVRAIAAPIPVNRVRTLKCAERTR